jgi:hypothetical protein
MTTAKHNNGHLENTAYVGNCAKMKMILLSLLFLVSISSCVVSVEYTHFTGMTKDEIRQKIAQSEKRDGKYWTAKIAEKGDGMKIHCISSTEALDEKDAKLDTLKIIDHELFFDSSEICTYDSATYLYSDDIEYDTRLATSSGLFWKWKKTNVNHLFINKHKKKLTLYVQQKTSSLPLLLIYEFHPNWTRKDYKKKFD